MADAGLLVGVLCGTIIIALCAAILGLGMEGRFAGPAIDLSVAQSGAQLGSPQAFDPTAQAPAPETFASPAPPVPETTPAAAPDVADEVPIAFPPMTDGACLVNIEAQPRVYQHAWCAELPQLESFSGSDPRYPACYPIGVPAWKPLDNVWVTLPDPAGCDVAVSDTWTIAGWYMTYVQLTPGAVFTPPPQSQDAQYLLKIVRGSVIDAGQSGIMREDGRWETFVMNPPLTVHSARVPYSSPAITAGENGAVFIWFVVSQEVMETPVTSMTEHPASTIAGPFSELLTWELFGDRVADSNMRNFWNMPGIRLAEYDGTHLHYNQWWTVREDDPVDGGYHDHAGAFANNTFGELHMAFFQATATAGMQTVLPGTQNLNFQPNPDPIPAGQSTWFSNNDVPEVQLTLPLLPGYVHGPLWAVDTATGNPIVNCNGGIVYPWHRHVLGTNPDGGPVAFHDPLRYHLWIAYEHPAQYCSTPPEMLAHWPNAYLQNQDGNYPDDCAEQAPVVAAATAP